MLVQDSGNGASRDVKRIRDPDDALRKAAFQICLYCFQTRPLRRSGRWLVAIDDHAAGGGTGFMESVQGLAESHGAILMIGDCVYEELGDLL